MWVRMTSWGSILERLILTCTWRVSESPLPLDIKRVVTLGCRSHSAQMRAVALPSGGRDGRTGLCRCPTRTAVKRDNVGCVNKYCMIAPR